MKDLRDFSFREWLGLMPALLAFKQVRNDAWLTYYKRTRPPELGAFLELIKSCENKNIALVIAFEQPWALDWQLRMARRFLADTTVLVFDNSRRVEARREIAQVCRDNGAPYLSLPANPTRHVNRSHGMAMTWIFYNVVRTVKPKLFAYLDHDMIPVSTTSFSASLGAQPFYGFRRFTSQASWNLWAGYCCYDFSFVADKKLNFLYDFSRGLDTGGRNWKPLYRWHEPDRMRFAENKHIHVHNPLTDEQFIAQVIDDCWFHIGGIGYNDNFRAKSDCCKNLARALDQGVSWRQMLADDKIN